MENDEKAAPSQTWPSDLHRSTFCGLTKLIFRAAKSVLAYQTLLEHARLLLSSLVPLCYVLLKKPDR